MPITSETTQGVSSGSASPLAFVLPQHHVKTAAANEEEKGKQQKKISVDEAQKKVQHINEQLKAMHTELSFSVDKETDKVVLKILNSKTGEVIRQIPAEDALRISSHISRLLGVMVDESA
jgi:flagellar protein FlaG